MALSTGFEPANCCLEISNNIQLGYEKTYIKNNIYFTFRRNGSDVRTPIHVFQATIYQIAILAFYHLR